MGYMQTSQKRPGDRVVKTALISACAFAGTLLMGVAGAQVVKMPPETAAYRASDLPGYSLAQRHCLMCHSAHYVTTQPPTSSRAIGMRL